MQNPFVKFEVCSDSTGGDSQDCQAYFDYYVDGYENDSTNNDDPKKSSDFTIHFFDYSYGNLTSWSWNFGDGTTSTEQNPVHVYTQEGVYAVTFTISGDNCENTMTDSLYIYNYTSDCQALFAYGYESINHDSESGDSIKTGKNDLMTLYFLDLSFGNIKDWNWDFGDGVTSTEQNPKHTYTEAGKYLVTLSISGDDCNSSVSISVYAGDEFDDDSIWEPETCMAYFYPVFDNYNYLQFVDLSYGEVDSWSWSFGDGVTSTEQNPAHTYTEEGEYNVTLTVQSGDTCSSSFEMLVYIKNHEYCDSTFTALFIPEIDGKKVTFHNHSTSNIENIHWDFGDGNTSEKMNPIHIYNKLDKYIVTLGISNKDEENTYTLEIDLVNNKFKGFFNGNGMTAINKSSTISNVTVYPNPVTDNTSISLSSTVNTSVNVFIISVDGKVISNTMYNINKGNNTININTENLQKGIYLLKINNNEKIATTKIIK
jgi:PKD repeat protein